MTTTLNSAAIKLVKSFEGLSLKPYLCPADVPTIGYGTTRYPDGKAVSIWDSPITEKQAEEYLLHDLEDACVAVLELVRVPLTENQFGALVSFVYNLGRGAFNRSTLLRKLNEKDYASAADNFLKWVNAGGKQLPGLVRRREAERALFLQS